MKVLMNLTDDDDKCLLEIRSGDHVAVLLLLHHGLCLPDHLLHLVDDPPDERGGGEGGGGFAVEQDRGGDGGGRGG